MICGDGYLSKPPRVSYRSEGKRTTEPVPPLHSVMNRSSSPTSARAGMCGKDDHRWYTQRTSGDHLYRFSLSDFLIVVLVCQPKGSDYQTDYGHSCY